MAIKFTDKILDNVHGFIEYTDAEKAVMDTLLFKRLQSIKQLSIANWIFPGSEHTRYIHSLGVMHIADKMAKQLELPDEDRKIIRMAGLLHDIGHYPLSHVCETPYKKGMENYQEDSVCQAVNSDIISKKLLNHEELPFVEDSEIRIISKDADEMKKRLYESVIYKEYVNSHDKVVLRSKKPMTKHVPYGKFIESIEENITEELQDDKEQYIKDRVLSRYMEGICVCNSRDGKIHLLCDDDKSLMKQLYGTNLVIFRAFQFPLVDKGKE